MAVHVKSYVSRNYSYTIYYDSTSKKFYTFRRCGSSKIEAGTYEEVCAMCDSDPLSKSES